MKLRYVIVMAICMSFVATVFAASEMRTAGDYPSVWVCDTHKFNWYCDPDESTPQANASAPISLDKEIDISKATTAKEVREALDALKDKATMQPSEENVKAYIAAQQYVFDKGSVFADTWRRVVWTNPEYDYSLRRPVNNTAIRSFDSQRDQSEIAQIRNLAKEHGIMFFFRSDCPFCHQLAPILKKMSRVYGIEILPVSVDGGGLPDYPRPMVNKGQAESLGIRTVPALYIASRKTGDMAPIGYGLLSESEIISRIFVLTNTKPGETF